MIKKLEFRASIAPIMSGIRTGGDGIRLTLDIPESDVQDAVALIALRNTPLRITVEVDDSKYATKMPTNGKAEEKPAKPKKVKPPKGPHSAYWEEMFSTHGFQNYPGLWTVLEVGSNAEVKARLHAEFGVKSLSWVSPDEFEAWCRQKAPSGALDFVIGKSRLASAKILPILIENSERTG